MSVTIYNYSQSILTEEQNEILINVFGYLGGALVASVMLPQVIKAYRRKRTKDISMKFLILQLLATIINLIYGALINELPMLVMLPIILIFTILIMIAKCLYDKNTLIEDMQNKNLKSKETQTTQI
jgi:uncharacterized protein with PQ loop repeat